MVKRTLDEIMLCMREGVEFDGTLRNKAKTGRKILITPGSVEENLIATWMESHCGFRFTTEQVNEHRKQQGDVGVSRYAVMAAFYRLDPKIDVLFKIVSGGHNEKWIQARFNVSKQMEVMMGNLTDEEVLKDRHGQIHHGPAPPMFEKNLLPSISNTQIAWWDECHIEQQGGKVGNKMYQYSFRRDETGKLCKHGEYKTDLETKTAFKYPEQGRFSFGVAKTQLLPCKSTPFLVPTGVQRESTPSPVPTGVRLPHIDYTLKNIVTIEVFEKHVKTELLRVKSLTGDSKSQWNVKLRPDGAVWGDDPVTLIPGAGGKKGKTLVAAGIITVSDLLALTDVQLQHIVSTTTGISLSTLAKWRSTPLSTGANPGLTVDYRLAANPYLAKYGTDDWKNKVGNSIFMRKFMCITELVQTIHDHSEAAFKGTTHEDDWYFYHDALSQMTAKSTVRWMKQRNIYRRWLIPLNGCNCGTVYVYRPVGNSPEFMPLDNSLNQDIQLSLSLHCAVTAHLPDNDPRKFSMRTPKTIQSGIQRIWGEVEGVPSSRRICDDCDRALAAFGIVYRAGGKMVPQLANRSGHRNHAAGRNSTGWGGVRVKNLLVAEIGRWLHADALQAKSERTADIIAEIEESDNENSLLGDDTSEGEYDDVSDSDST